MRAAAIATVALTAGCWSDASIVQRTAPRRAASIDVWREHDPAATVERMLAQTPVVRTVEPFGAPSPPPGSSEALPPRWAAITLGVGAAVPVAADGYLLTAAHVLEGGVPLVVPRDRTGALDDTQTRVARVVWSGVQDARPVDLALLHVALAFEPSPWVGAEHLADTIGAPILVVGSDGAAAGRVGSFRAPAPGVSVAPVRITAPVVPGDSGGPAVLGDGRIVGVLVRVNVGGLDGVTRSADLRWIDAAFVEREIERDRARSPSAQPSSSDATSALSRASSPAS